MLVDPEMNIKMSITTFMMVLYNVAFEVCFESFMLVKTCNDGL